MSRSKNTRARHPEVTSSIEPARHLLVDFWGCSPEALRDLAALEDKMCHAATDAGATVVDTTFHHFAGGGVTGVVAVKESHLTIHTWPETAYAAVDIFLCGSCEPEAALETLRRYLRPTKEKIAEQTRAPESAAMAAAAVDSPVATGSVATGSLKRRAKDAGRSLRSAAESALEPGSLAPVYALALLLAACSIIYELLLAQTLAALLGSTVLRYSITIGCYLGALGIGAMLCSPERVTAAKRLVSVEIALSLLGGLSVPLFYFFDMAQRYFYYIADTPLAESIVVPAAFFFLTHSLIIGIGLLSGFEVPLLLAMAENRRPGSTNRVLGVDYLGALLGSVLFPLVFLRTFGLLATGFSIAALNAIACAALALSLKRFPRVRFGGAMAGAAVASLLVALVVKSGTLEQYFLQKFYYLDSQNSLASVVVPNDDARRVEHYRSLYQSIDLVSGGNEGMWAWEIVSSKTAARPDLPDDLRLYINRDYQFYSGMEEVYHEWFVHVPPQAVGRAPRRVLVLGGGDNLALREIIRYDTVERVVHVELDPQMVELAETHPVLTALNGRPHEDPRVTTVIGDAFDWLRRHPDKFDAVYVDMPYPRDYNLAQVYSREFYSLIRSHLTDDGFLMLDAPDSDCRKGEDSLWPIYQSTLDAAGFERVVPVLSRFNLNEPFISEYIASTAYPIAQKIRSGELEVPFDARLTEAWLRGLVDDQVNSVFQEFVLALPAKRELNTTWVAMGVDLHALAPAHLPLAFHRNCPDERRPLAINSVFRPTLPVLRFDHVSAP